MESRAFIRQSSTLVRKIYESQNTIGTAEQLRIQRENLQTEIRQLFAGLQNPTLPSAYRLRDTAMRYGFVVDAKILHRLAQLESV
jgi:hypothetical protein